MIYNCCLHAHANSNDKSSVCAWVPVFAFVLKGKVFLMMSHERVVFDLLSNEVLTI